MRPLAALLALLVPSLAFAAAPAAKKPVTLPATLPPYTLEHALTLNSISNLTWSGNGRRLAFVVTSIDTAETAQNQDLWLYDRATDRSTRLTRHPKNDFSPTFSPGGDTIAFVATRATGDDAKSSIYMLPLRGGER